jgi:hypothetical protein
MIYAGIGSRSTPLDILNIIRNAAIHLATLGYTLRSGGADGADSAFEAGCDSINGSKEIFYAHQATQDSIEHASKFHPSWTSCSTYVKKLHARNSMILLGKELLTPVSFVICWTPMGNEVGGTGQGIRVARSLGIKILNLGIHQDLNRVKSKLNI